jgi:23S rRNA pseudouridine2605 synthase
MNEANRALISMQERLQKIISRAGIASRRHAEQLILSGAVTVNGKVVTELGTRADAERDHITVGPRVVRLESGARRGYFAFNKPAQVVSTLSDPEGRPCLGPYLRAHAGRLIPVGRLEFDAGGLLLVTGDGELASDLMRASAAIPQTWRFKVKGRIPESARQAIERGAHTRVRTHQDAANAWYEATLQNAARDRLRLMLQRQGILVEKMVRTGFAGIELGTLPAGQMRELSPAEVNTLRKVVRGEFQPAKAPVEIPVRPAQARRKPEGREGIANAVSAWRGRRRHGPATSFAGGRRTGHGRHGPERKPTR